MSDSADKDKGPQGSQDEQGNGEWSGTTTAEGDDAPQDPNGTYGPDATGTVAQDFGTTMTTGTLRPPLASVWRHPSLPPLSGSEKMKQRRSKSLSYNNAVPEWYYKPSPTLPMIWVRDAYSLTEMTVAVWDKAWRRYNALGIAGKGDGCNSAAATRHGRRRLEEEYAKLDPDIKLAKEVALARYKNFCLRGTDGTLDYHTEPVMLDRAPLLNCRQS